MNEKDLRISGVIFETESYSGSFWYSSTHSDRLLIAGNKPLWAKLKDGSIVEYTAMDCKTGYGDERYLGEGTSLGAMSYKTAHELKQST